jgi:mRNA interferase MazF
MIRSNIPKRGEIWIVDLDPTRGSEIQKKRTAVVLSANGLGVLPLHIIVPITGWQPKFATAPWLLKLEPTKRNGLAKESGADAFQIRSVSRERFLHRLGVLGPDEIEEIAYRVAFCIGLKPL